MGLEDGGWAETHQVFARPLPPLTSPIATWHSDEPMPAFSSISHHLINRFNEPAVATMVVVASRATCKRFGSPSARPPRRAEATHDLGLASVYLLFLQDAPDRAAAWISEAWLIREGEGRCSKLADAMLRLPSGQEIVIEFGGEYSKEKLHAFHADCQNRNRGYELW